MNANNVRMFAIKIGMFILLFFVLLNDAQRMAICGGRDLEAPTYQTVANLSKCTKVKFTCITRLTYIACYQLGFIPSV